MKLDLRDSIPTQLIGAAAVILVLAGGTRMLKGINPQPDPPGVWGMMGVTASDTIRINVVNMQFAGLTPASCNVTMKFLDDTGKVLKQSTVTIKTTQAVSLDYTPGGGAGFRTEVHPAVSVPSTEPVGCSAIGSAEVFNTISGETVAFAHPIYIPLPQTVTGQPSASRPAE
ncbi:MAG TPA: hypothetical protein VMI94_03080 [Bryobacteraceae bacterium]|nr:hypothetical protein [Bryobacteraceae bacterium]